MRDSELENYKKFVSTQLEHLVTQLIKFTEGDNSSFEIPSEKNEFSSLFMAVSKMIKDKQMQISNEYTMSDTFSKSLIETANAIIISLDVNANITIFNKFAEKLTGYSKEQVIGKNWFQLFIPKRIQHEIPKVFNKVLQKMPDVSSYENPILCKNGEERLINWNNTLLKDQNGNPSGTLSIGLDITEKEQITEELQRSEEQLKLITDNVPVLISYVDAEQRFRFNNRGYEEWFGQSSSEIYGKHIQEVLGEKTYKAIRENVIKVISGQKVAFHSNIPFKDGDTRYVAVSYVPHIDEKGKVKGFFALVNDITKLKQIEEKLRISNERLNFLLASTTAVIYSSRATDDFGATFISENVRDQLGYDPQDFTQNSAFWMDHIHPDDQERVLNGLVGLFEEGHHVHEYRFALPDGSYRWMRDEVNLIRDKDSYPQECVGCWVDVTERKKVENELRRNTRELAARNRIIGIFLTVSDDEMYTNVLLVLLEELKSKYGVFGYLNESGDLVVPTMTRTIWEQCQVEDKSFIFKQQSWSNSSWPRAIREKRTIWSNQPSVNTPKGHIQITRHISLPLINQDQVVGLIQVANKDSDYTDEDVGLLETIGKVIAPVLDIRLKREQHEAARQRAEKSLKKRTDELNSANKELEQLIYTASHDLRTPLVNIQGFNKELDMSVQELSDILKDESIPVNLEKKISTILNENIPESLKFILTSAEKMDALLSGLLSLSRSGRQKLIITFLDMNKIIKDIIANFQFEINNRNITLKMSKLPSCYADEGQISQVFSNLIGNAIKFSHPDRAGIITITGKKDNSCSVYSIQDNGIGIQLEHQKKIFELFEKLDPDVPGTGLGLTISKQIIERHDGSIQVQSEPGVGSMFTVILQATKEK